MKFQHRPIVDLRTARVSKRMVFAMDFAAGFTDPVIGGGTMTTTRAGATATRVTSAGIVETVAANTARLDYNPNTFVLKGLLQEPAHTNLCIHSAAFDNGSGWVNTASGINANAVTGPDGGTTGDGLTATNVNAGHYINSAGMTIGAGNRVHAAVWAKAGSETTFDFYVSNVAVTRFAGRKFTLSGAGSTGATDAAAAGSWSADDWRITAFPNGWYLCEVEIITAVELTAQLYFYSRGSNVWVGPGGATNTLYLWGADFKIGTGWTSHIPTAGVAVTRPADQYTVATGSWYNAAESTLVSEATPTITSTGAARIMVEIDDGTTANRHVLYCLSDIPGEIRNFITLASVTQANILSGVNAVRNTTFKAASAIKANDFALAVNGGAALTDVAGSVPATGNIMRIGGNVLTAEYFGGHIKRIGVFATRRDNGSLSLLTV